MLLGACVHALHKITVISLLYFMKLDSEVIWYMLRTENESRPTINLKHLKLPPEHHYTSLFPLYKSNILSPGLSLTLSLSLSLSLPPSLLVSLSTSPVCILAYFMRMFPFRQITTYGCVISIYILCPIPKYQTHFTQ